jgi:hypothetical protein
LRPVPTVGVLAIHGAAPGMQISVDQKVAGTVGQDGNLSVPGIAPGSRTIELSDGQRHKQLSRLFKAGETLQLGPPDVVLQAAKVAVKITVSPANAVVSYRTPDNKSHEVHGPGVELEEGQYVFTATAPGHIEGSQPLVVTAGKPANVVLTLKARSVTPKIGAARMEDWAVSGNWKLEDNWYVHRGGGLVLYPTVPTAGSFVFSAMRKGGLLGKGRIQWVAGCSDDKNYVLFGIDKKNVHRQEVSDGKKQKETSESLKTGTAKELAYTLKIDISSENIVTSVQQGGSWVVVDTWPASGLNPANAKFGFYLPGTDEIYLSNFSFSPK